MPARKPTQRPARPLCRSTPLRHIRKRPPANTRGTSTPAAATQRGPPWRRALRLLRAASAAVLSILKPGDEVAAAADLYGGTYRLLERVFKPWGLVARYTEDASSAGFQKIITAATRLVWIETPTNPLLQILDIAAIADLAQRAGALLAVDNT